jgi:hypothetical protein
LLPALQTRSRNDGEKRLPLLNFTMMKKNIGITKKNMETTRGRKYDKKPINAFTPSLRAACGEAIQKIVSNNQTCKLKK